MRQDARCKSKRAALVAQGMVLIVLLLAIPGVVLAAKGGIKGPPDGGEEATGNNLSFPAIFNVEIDASWVPPTNPVLGTHFSYGCDKAETYGIYSYPNTSCVDDLMAPTVYYTAEECTDATQPSPCEGLPIYPVYWQKVDANNWSADQDSIAISANVDHVDWGDALEAVSWTERSKIRVETQPYSSKIPGFDPTLSSCGAASFARAEANDPGNPDNANAPYDDCKVGFQMWHVSGQGITEQWGVRADDETISFNAFNYDSPFQIINVGSARLNLAKMATETAECPSSGGGDEEVAALMAVNAAPGSFEWDAINHLWLGALGSGTADPCTWQDAPFSVELSVGGKYVYGYNWAMGNVNLDSACGPEWLKTGWWRLTFYTTDDAIEFDNAAAPVTAPPAMPAVVRSLPRTTFNAALAPGGEPVESDALYTPVVDVGNNLTYLDICIVGKTQGGGGGGGRPK